MRSGFENKGTLGFPTASHCSFTWILVIINSKGDGLGPVGHFLVSSAVGGGVWAVTGSPVAAGVTVAVGVLMDVDHVYDYYQRYARGKYGKLYVPLHAWEYSLVGLGLLALGLNHPIFLGAVLAHLTHVGTDQWHNGLGRFSYSITYRAIKGFNFESIVGQQEMAHAGHVHPKRFAFDRRLSLWFEAKARGWLLRRANGKHRHQPTVNQADD